MLNVVKQVRGKLVTVYNTLIRRGFEVLRANLNDNGYGAGDALTNLTGNAITTERIVKSTAGFSVVWKLLHNDNYLHTFHLDDTPSSSQSHKVSL